MTETEKKALALVNEVATPGHVYDLQNLAQSRPFKALCRAIEQHEAFKREVSDAVEKALYQMRANQLMQAQVAPTLTHFIIPKPDPLVEAVDELWTQDRDKAKYMADQLHKYLAASGLEVRKIGEGE